MNRKISLLLSLLTSLTIPAITVAQGFDAGNTPIVGNTNITINQLIGLKLSILWFLFVGFAVIMFIIAGFNFLVA